MIVKNVEELLSLVDELRTRGAHLIEIDESGGVRLGFAPGMLTNAPEKRDPRPRKSFHDRLFRHLPKDERQ